LALTLALLLLMNWQGAALVTAEAPLGIVSFELAGTIERAQAILTSWDEHARLNAAFGLGFDFLFMLVYSSTLALACLWSGEALREHRWPLAGLGAPLAGGQWLAALCDVAENIALFLLLLGPAAAPWPALARTAALIKFGLIFTGMVYGILGWVVGTVSRLTAGK
jgi:hypothetical protein